MAGAALAFGIARALGRPAAARIVPQAMLEWADAGVARGGWMVALAVRFIPLFPFSLINFAFGLTRLSWTIFLWTTGVQTVLPWALLVLIGLTALGMAFRHRLARPTVDAAGRAR